MRIHILCTINKPLRAYADKQEAYREYRRLQDMDDYIDYSVISMPVQGVTQQAADKPAQKSECISGNDFCCWKCGARNRTA